jgi:hypothetical protein
MVRDELSVMSVLPEPPPASSRTQRIDRDAARLRSQQDWIGDRIGRIG